MGLTSTYIFNICSRYCTKFKGVFPSDRIPKNISNNSCLIVNLDVSDQPGTHFVGIFIGSEFIIYFDPLGFPCFNPHILEFFETTDKTLIETNHQIQNFNSSFCGFFCIAYVMSIECNFSTENFLKYFDKENTKKNDKKVVSFIKLCIKKLSK